MEIVILVAMAFLITLVFFLLSKQSRPMSKRFKNAESRDFANIRGKNLQAIYLQNKQKGDKYELQIGQLYQKGGYKVHFRGMKEGVRDKGIDLIAYKGSEAVLIQCKNWEKSQVKQEHLRIFLGDCAAYLEQNQKIFAKKKVRRVFITSCQNIDYGVKKFVEENAIEYRIVPYQG